MSSIDSLVRDLQNRINVTNSFYKPAAGLNDGYYKEPKPGKNPLPTPTQPNNNVVDAATRFEQGFTSSRALKDNSQLRNLPQPAAEPTTSKNPIPTAQMPKSATPPVSEVAALRGAAGVAAAGYAIDQLLSPFGGAKGIGASTGNALRDAIKSATGKTPGDMINDAVWSAFPDGIGPIAGRNKKAPSTNIPSGLQPKERLPGEFNPTPGNRSSFGGVPVAITFYAPGAYGYRTYEVLDFEIQEEPNAWQYPPSQRFSVQFTQPNGSSTYADKNGPQIDISTFSIAPVPGQRTPPQLQNPLPARSLDPNWKPADAPIGIVPTAPPQTAPPKTEPTPQKKPEDEKKNAPFPFLLPIPVPSGGVNAKGAPPSVSNPVGKDGNLDPNKRNEINQSQQNRNPQPDQTTPALCQNSCVADLQRGQQNQNQITTVTVDKFLAWNRLTGRAIYTKEPIEVPANMAPFARMMGDRTADIRSRFGLAEIRAKLAHLMNVLNTITLLHNAAMLSTNLAQTLGDVVTQGVQTFAPFFGVDQSVADTFDANEILGKAVDETMKTVLGKEVWEGTKTTWHKANRIISTASQIVWTIRSISDSTREVMEWTAENTGKIGNALKRFRVVGENAYRWMPESVTAQGRWRARIDRVTNGIESADDAASSLSSVVGEVRNAKDEFGELKEQREAFDKAIKEATAKERPNNEPTTKAANESNQASKSPELQLSDRDKGGD